MKKANKSPLPDRLQHHNLSSTTILRAGGRARRSPQIMKALILIGLSLFAGVFAALADKPKTENKDWEQACGGSNIAVTSVAGKIVTIDAVAEHFAEGRQWQCHFKDGEIISAVYRHFTVTRKAADDAGQFTTESKEDRVEVFHLPDHDLSKLDPELRKDLAEVIAIAKNQGEQDAPSNGG